MRNMKRVQIVFNLNDPYQKKLYDYLIEKADTNVSSYGRMLVKKDMIGEFKTNDSQDESNGTIDENSFI